MVIVHFKLLLQVPGLYCGSFMDEDALVMGGGERDERRGGKKRKKKPHLYE